MFIISSAFDILWSQVFLTDNDDFCKSSLIRRTHDNQNTHLVSRYKTTKSHVSSMAELISKTNHHKIDKSRLSFTDGFVSTAILHETIKAQISIPRP